uniref:Complex I intermediate-associated protein 30, mitochondrial n=1 Tax=Ciona savignyi TaxID=51511 RepID=H2Y4E5_CIOSA
MDIFRTVFQNCTRTVPFCRFQRILDNRNHGIIFKCRTLFTPAAKPPKNSQVVVKAEDEIVRLQEKSIDWERLKHSWKYFRAIMKNKFSKADDHAMASRSTKADQIIYYFRNTAELENWYIMTDEDVGGKSWAELVQGPNEMTAAFRGYIHNTPPPDYVVSHDPLEPNPPFYGFAYVETKPFEGILGREQFMNFQSFSGFKIRLRGDGRKYLFETLCDFGFDNRMMYNAPIYTNGGPLWQEITIPFVKLIASKNSGAVVKQRAMAPDRMSNFRFLIKDQMEGPFHLEIDYIAFIRDVTYDVCTTGIDYYDPWEPINSNSGM